VLVGLTAFSQKVVSLQMGDCKRDSYPMFMHRNRLIQKELKNDTLILRLGIVRNCSFSPMVEIDYVEDTLMLNISNISTDYAACDCCYELDLHIVGVSDTNFTLGETFMNNDIVDIDDFEVFIDQEFKEWIDFEEFNYHPNKFIFPTLEEVESITEYDQLYADSLKIGLWIQYSHYYPNNYSKVFYFIYDFGKSRIKWSISYNGKQEITEVRALKGIDPRGISELHSINGEKYLNLMSTNK
jgi:hypothetical protein